MRRNGTAVKLQPQPAKLLAVLATRAGEVVTRQELTDEVWGQETHVDFEHGLNYAIQQIRSVLEDDPKQPRFLETVPRRGYRFIANVEPLARTSSMVKSWAQGNGHEKPFTAEAMPQSRSHRLAIWIAISSVTLVVGVILALRVAAAP